MQFHVEDDRSDDPWQNCLVGTLETWPLTDVIMWLHQMNRTAMVRVGSGMTAGVLFFQKGELFRVEWGRLRGEEALMGLLNLNAGSFTLIQRAPPQATQNIFRPAIELLLQLAVAQDENTQRASA